VHATLAGLPGFAESIAQVCVPNDSSDAVDPALVQAWTVFALGAGQPCVAQSSPLPQAVTSADQQSRLKSAVRIMGCLPPDA